MTVGLFLTAGIISLFLATKQSYRSNEALAVVQEDGRYQLERLATDLRQSGSLGCQRTLMLQDQLPPAGTANRLMHDSLSIKNTLALTDDDLDPDEGGEPVFWWLYNFAEQPPIEAFEGTGSQFDTNRPPLGISLSTLLAQLNLDEAIDEHDMIVTRRAFGSGIPIVRHDSAADALIIKESEPGDFFGSDEIDVGDIAIVSTCEYATLFHITDIVPDPNCDGLLRIEHEVLSTCNDPFDDDDDEDDFDCPVNKGLADEDPGDSASLGFRFANDTDFAASCPTSSELDDAIDDAIGHLYLAQVGIYYVRETDEGIPAVYFKDNLKRSEQLITGVYGLEALFGRNSLAASCDSADNAPSLDTYSPANEVDNWNEINAVKLSLILGSAEEEYTNVVEEPVSLPFPNDSGTFDAEDLDAEDQKRLYQAFTSTIFLRNKLPCLGMSQWTEPSSN